MIYIVLGILGFLALFIGVLFWNKPILLIYGVVIFCFVSDLFISNLHMPESIHYVADFLSIYLMLIGIVLELIKPHRLYAVAPFIIILILGGIALASFCLNDYSLVTFGIGAFQFFRGFCFFIACICILEKEDVRRLSKLFMYAAFANLFISLFEYFTYHSKWDNNGGLFGIIVGCNGKMNIYIVIVTSLVAVLYLNRKISTLLTAGVLGCCLITATISELKIYYLELIFCIALAVLLSKPSKKTVFFVVGGALAIRIAVFVLGQLYPLFADFFNVETMIA